MRTSVHFACALALLAHAGCEGSRTEIMVVVDSDLSITEIDSITVEVSGAASATGTVNATMPLPRTVGVVQRGGSLGPLEIRAAGLLGGTVVVERRASTSFVSGRTLLLYMFLSRRCAGVGCGAAETCDLGSCISSSVDPATLPEWNGTIDRVDGGQCVPGAERCNAVDDDCDGMVDEDFNFQTDPANCGACLRSCAEPNATVACVAATCQVTGCNAGFGDCDTMPGNGCEADLSTDPMHCNACNTPCTFDHATGVCNAGTCELGTCTNGFGNCEVPPDPSNGCETALTSLTDCGACATPCTVPVGTPTCMTGMCEIDTCDAGFEDCNGARTDGCERSITTVTDCGACGAVCALINASARMCDTSTMPASCSFTCNTNFDDCDGIGSNGCETDLRRDENNCGMCGNVCMGANPRCMNNVCQ